MFGCNDVNTAGKSFIVSENNKIWIVDTSATHHAVSNLDMMSKGSMTQLDTPSGNTTQVTLVGNNDLSANNVVTNIFCLPALQHNLLHVSKTQRN